ncbi:ankyrin repeat protein [Leptolyngbya sp. Heron Island J]|uniref:ankyrin repeat domain-containing protein n=1 Tax=Leptolyngbya sp. Heron Island J TaxID=1385935 RepID=UPI0003B9617E|nr:ankyrin repeat domain-containing protein [Leptolyngbya sp. Heron Island J]ESA36348.1 ankyrin repeat protein [Leptolyngbya sp. Heron Island J]
MPSIHESFVNACIRGDLAVVKQHLVDGADVEGIWRSCTGLMWAAAEGYLPVVELLLQVGANVNTRNEVNYTAILYAAETDQRDIVLTLLDHGAQTDASVCNRYEETILLLMARQGHADIVERLAQRGDNLHHTNKIGDTALYLAVNNGHAPTVASLIKLGANVNTANIGGWTPLMMASARGDIDIIEMLLAQGADVTPTNRWGGTALSEAQQSFRSSQAVAMLRQAGAE